MLEVAREGLRTKKLPKPVPAFVVLSVIYVVLTVALPPNAQTIQTYHLTATEYRILALFLSIPSIIVWFTAFYGYSKLDEYIMLVKKTPQGRALTNISAGLKFLAWGVPITTIISEALAGITRSVVSFANFTLISTHYMSLLVAILAFTCIGIGSRALTDISHTRLSLAATRWVMLMYTFLGVLFTYVTVRAVQTHNPNPFRLPMWLILLTIIAPYLYAWSMGLFAAYEIFLYGKQTKGVLYRQAFVYLSGGLVMTIITSVVLEYMLSDTTHIRKISFDWLFIGFYVLLLLYACGFLLISSGAKRLKKIEEV